MLNKPIIWSISALDCTTSWGSQADLLTMNDLGAQAATVSTALCSEVARIECEAVDESILLKQLNQLAQQLPAKVIKLGYIANQSQLQVLVQQILYYRERWPQPPLLLYQPIFQLKQQQLASASLIQQLNRQLLPLVDVICIGVTEVQQLTGIYLINAEAARQAAAKLMSLGVGAVIIKGGDWAYPGDICVDYFALYKGAELADGFIASKWLEHAESHWLS